MSADRSEKILYYTESMLREWVDRRKCVPVPAGVNLGLFNENETRAREIRRGLGISQEDIVFGYVGTFQDWHGVDTLLLATPALFEKHGNIHVLLVGPGYQKYSVMAEKLGISNLCRFTGGVNYEDVPSYISACDIMTALYNPEVDPLRKKYGIGWPLKILEYMACRRPVVSTRVAPIDRIITCEELGVLIQPGDKEGLFLALHSLVGDEKRTDEMKDRGRRLVEENYSWQSVAKLVSSFL